VEAAHGAAEDPLATLPDPSHALMAPESKEPRLPVRSAGGTERTGSRRFFCHEERELTAIVRGPLAGGRRP
jgi:hypothetical protein